MKTSVCGTPTSEATPSYTFDIAVIRIEINELINMIAIIKMDG